MRHQALPDSCFLVLALLAEGETHGYDIQKLVHNRGFRFWTRIQRSSIYNALSLLEKRGLIAVQLSAGEGPDRKVYRITKKGNAKLQADGIRHLSDPGHPRSEIDLGIYALPFLPRANAKLAFDACLKRLQVRRAFLSERLSWCRERGLGIPALAFERPLLALDAEISWLERAAQAYIAKAPATGEWGQYVYRASPTIGLPHVARRQRSTPPAA